MIKTKKLIIACIVFVLITCCFSFKVQSQTTTSYLKTFEVDKDTYLKIPEINIQDATVSYAYKNQGTEYQFNITLTKPLIGNSVSIPIETKGLEFYYQPPLDQELNLKEYDFVNSTHSIRKNQVIEYRPVNIVGSYAVYKTNPANSETGKLYHIYRPLIIDSKGASVWGQLEVTKTELKIIIDSKFLTTAVYPVIIDPTFGNTNVGATTLGGTNAYLVGGHFTCPEAGEATSLSVYLKYPDGNLMGGVYGDNAGAPNALVGSASSSTAISGADGWQTVTITATLANAEYWLIWQTSSANPNRVYDSGDANDNTAGLNTYGSFPSPFPSPAYGNRLYSIYVTYTTSTPATSESLTVELNQPLNASTTTMFPNNFNYTPTLLGSDSFKNASLIINGSSVASNSSALSNATLNTIAYTFAENGTYLWNVQVYNSTHAVQATNNFTLTVGVYEAPEPTPTPTPTATPTATTTTIGDLTTDEAAAIGLFFGLIALVLAVALPLAYRRKHQNDD